MELIAKVNYHCSHGSLYVGESTEGREFPEEKKQQMLADFPDWFEVIQGQDATPVEGAKKQRSK